jgi:hypothetical protein
MKPIDKDQVPVRPQIADVSAVKPTLFERLSRLLRVLVIPQAKTGMAKGQLSPVGYFYL